uniref:hypothetical protein n=1 Tax=Bradyrhizobium sp. th-b2 TaxID=172088 RepID=UPI0005677F71
RLCLCLTTGLTGGDALSGSDHREGTMSKHDKASDFRDVLVADGSFHQAAGGVQAVESRWS